MRHRQPIPLYNYLVIALFLLIVPFLLLGCQHGPPHDDLVVPDTCGDTKGAVWVNEPGREGGVTVTWFPSSADPSVIHTDIDAAAPLIGDARGPLSQIKNKTISRFGGETFIAVCCRNHEVTKTLIVAHGTGKEFTFNGGNNGELIPMGNLPLIGVQTWTVNHCRKSDQDHTDRPVDFPISVEMTCKRPNGNEYRVETTLEYKTLSTCKHAF